MIQTAYIKLWGQRVGAVLWNPERQIADFEYDANYLKTGFEVAPLQMPLQENIFNFPALRNNATFKGLPGLLADSLPDKYGNTLINTWLLRKGRELDSMNPVEMLCFVGTRGMGALEYEPASMQSTTESSKIELSELITVAREILNQKDNFRTQITEDKEKAMIDILKMGTSAGGARAKALIAYNAQNGEVRSGQSDVLEGFEHYLIKFDGVHDSQFGESFGYGRVEMAYHLMAVAAGIHMTDCQLLEEQGRAHFMTKRFDRTPQNGKLHVQTWCAMMHYDFQNVGMYSYEQLFQTMRALRLPYSQAEQMYRRMVFNILSKNCDDHTKNFAFTMDATGTWALAPAYDICYAYRPGSIWVSKQSLSMCGKREGFERADFLEIAKLMNIKKANDIIVEIEEILQKWPEYAEKVGVNEALSQRIAQNLLKI